jgi:hypothetical protein
MIKCILSPNNLIKQHVNVLAILSGLLYKYPECCKTELYYSTTSTQLNSELQEPQILSQNGLTRPGISGVAGFKDGRLAHAQAKRRLVERCSLQPGYFLYPESDSHDPCCEGERVRQWMYQPIRGRQHAMSLERTVALRSIRRGDGRRRCRCRCRCRCAVC